MYVVNNVPWLIFSMNNIPKASDCSHGYFRRFLYVVFNHIVPEELQNKHLADDLKAEYPGILNWIRRGGKYLRQRRYVFPKSENSEKQKLYVIGQGDVVSSWMLARGVRASAQAKGELAVWIKSSELFADMEQYVELNNFESSVTSNAFGRAMQKHGFIGASRKRQSDGIYYYVYGCSEEELKTPPPVINDIDMFFEDELNKAVEFDDNDI